MHELIRWSPMLGEVVPVEGQRCTSLDLTTPEGQRTAYRCHVGADLRLKDVIGQPIRVRDFYAHHVVRDDETTGEIKPGVRCVLVLDDGRLIVTSSEVAVKCLQAYATLFQQAPPWEPPLSFVPRFRKGGRGEYIYLDLPEANGQVGARGKEKGR